MLFPFSGTAATGIWQGDRVPRKAKGIAWGESHREVGGIDQVASDKALLAGLLDRRNFNVVFCTGHKCG